MREAIKQISAPSTSDLFHNTGGPRSRVRSEQVRVSFLSDKESAVELGYYGIDLPEHISDIEEWLLHIAGKKGWHGWGDINRHIILPKERLMIFPLPEKRIKIDSSKKGIIKAALILSKSNQFCYLPQGPMIFTRSRLNRKIKLLKINIEHFYGLE